MFHRGHFGLGWRHLHRKRYQATLSDLAITCQARIPDNFTKNSLRLRQKTIFDDRKNTIYQKARQTINDTLFPSITETQQHNLIRWLLSPAPKPYYTRHKYLQR